MMSDSRKARRDSFASQRARLHFDSQPLAIGLGVLSGCKGNRTSRSVNRRDMVREGLIGFIPSGAH